MLVRPVPAAASAGGAFNPVSAWDASQWLKGADITAWMLIRQPDHARLAGEFARRWGNERFPAPQPRDQAILGISFHDEGWVEQDALPQRNPETGAPRQFLELSAGEFLPIWERSILRGYEHGPAAGWLVSWHFSELAKMRLATAETPAANRKAFEMFVERQEKSREQALAHIMLHGREQLAACGRLLQFCDLLSLCACLVPRPQDAPITLPQSFVLRSGEEKRIRLEPNSGNWGDSGDIRLVPYPFDVSEMRLSVPARRLSRARFESDRELLDEFRSAKEEKLTFRFVP